jgi:hypothetical protein
MTARWYREAVAAHERELAKPQCFPLKGDGASTKELIRRAVNDGRLSSADQLRKARYWDWGKER